MKTLKDRILNIIEDMNSQNLSSDDINRENMEDHLRRYHLRKTLQKGYEKLGNSLYASEQMRAAHPHLVNAQRYHTKLNDNISFENHLERVGNDIHNEMAGE